MASLVLKMSVSLDGYVASFDGSTGWLAAGRSDDSTSWVVETVTNAGAHLIGAATYAEWAGYWPTASGPFAKAMNEIPKVVFLELAHIRRLGQDGDRHRRPRRGDQATQAATLLRRIPARPGRDTLRPIACRDRLDRRVPPRHPPGRPGRGRADLHRTAHHRIGEHHRLQRRSRRPRLRRAPVIEHDRQPGSGSASSTLPPCRPGSHGVPRRYSSRWLSRCSSTTTVRDQALGLPGDRETPGCRCRRAETRRSARHHHHYDRAPT